MISRPDVIVIGAGHNGLVCAAYLADAGLSVTVLEASSSAGGMAAPRTLGEAYHFPGLAHFSSPVTTAIARDLKLSRYGYEPGDAVDTLSLSSDGQHVTIGSDGISGAAVPGTDVAAWPGFIARYRQFAKSVSPLFENKPPRLKHMGVGDMATLARLGWNIRLGLGRGTMYEFLRVAAANIYDVLNEVFEDDCLKGAIAADAVLGNAMGPRTPGSVITWLQRLHAEQSGSPTVQAGGAAQLSHALSQSAENAGANIRLNTRVARILVQDNRAFGVETADGEIIKSKAIVSNADAKSTFLNMIGAPQLDTMFANRVTQIRGDGVVAKLNIALRGLPEFRGVDDAALRNRLLIAPSMRYVEHAFNHSKYAECSDEPVLEVTIPSLHNAGLAPDGHHVMSINVAFVPREVEGGWSVEKSTYAYRVIAKLGEYAPQLKSLIVDHEFLTPADIEQETGITGGHWHHGDLAIHQSFMMRPVHGAAQYDTPVAQLFLCGAGCHPGGGLTGLPGRNAARRVLDIGDVK